MRWSISYLRILACECLWVKITHRMVAAPTTANAPVTNCATWAAEQHDGSVSAEHLEYVDIILILVCLLFRK